MHTYIHTYFQFAYIIIYIYIYIYIYRERERERDSTVHSLTIYGDKPLDLIICFSIGDRDVSDMPRSTQLSTHEMKSISIGS